MWLMTPAHSVELQDVKQYLNRFIRAYSLRMEAAPTGGVSGRINAFAGLSKGGVRLAMLSATQRHVFYGLQMGTTPETHFEHRGPTTGTNLLPYGMDAAGLGAGLAVFRSSQIARSEPARLN